MTSFSGDNVLIMKYYCSLKVMPLIKRDTYELPEGPRKGEKYALTDIMQVRPTSFITSECLLKLFFSGKAFEVNFQNG